MLPKQSDSTLPQDAVNFKETSQLGEYDSSHMIAFVLTSLYRMRRESQDHRLLGSNCCSILTTNGRCKNTFASHGQAARSCVGMMSYYPDIASHAKDLAAAVKY